MIRYDDQDSLMMHRSGIGNRVNLIDKTSNNDTLRPNMKITSCTVKDVLC